MRILFSGILSFLSLAVAASAQIVRETVEYEQGGTPLEGYLAYDESDKGVRPGVIVIHEWNGLGDYVKMRADELARLGYVALAIDIYGKGVRPSTPQEMGAQASKYRNDIPLMRSRAEAGLDELLRRSDLVDSAKIAVIGYCFGGGVALELARSGAALAGVASFHGNLDTPDPSDARNIKGKVLVLHGGSDPNVIRDKVAAFQDEMTNAGVDWQMIIYGGAVHGFTNPNNGNDPSKGAAYNEKADRRSWEAMKHFFDEIFK
jgi:dienelactone hydrolase